MLTVEFDLAVLLLDLSFWSDGRIIPLLNSVKLNKTI